jgi:branched-chain amino acid transport system permease protein
MRANYSTRAIALCLLAALICAFALPSFVGPGWISLLSEILILSIAACGYNLMMGYTGMVSFGPAGQYAIGAYTTGIIIVKTNLPFSVAILAGPVLAGFLSIIIGWFCVRRTEVYFSLLTLAFAQIVYTIIQKWYGFTGGDDGLVGISVPSLISHADSYYYFTLLVTCAALFVMWKIVNSPFGKIIQGIRENPRRAEFITLNVRRYQLSVFVISAFFLGLAGSLYSGFNRSIFPANIDVVKSTDIIVVCLLGGMHHFFGPVLGSTIYIFVNKIIANFTQYWALVLGTIIVLLVLYAKGGVAEYIDKNLLFRNKEI